MTWGMGYGRYVVMAQRDGQTPKSLLRTDDFWEAASQAEALRGPAVRLYLYDSERGRYVESEEE